MGRNRKKRTNYEHLEILDFAAEGKCIAKDDEKVVFIPYTAPGDVVDAVSTKKRKNYVEATATHFHKESELRTNPECEHFGLCGGCKWQHITYSTQAQFKAQQVSDQLTRIGKLALPTISPIIACEDIYQYRNKLEYTFTSRRWLTKEELDSGEEFERNGVGFHVPGGFDKVLDINKCWLQDDVSNQIRIFIKDYGLEKNLSFYNIRAHEGLLRNLIIRNTKTGELMVIVQFGEPSDAIKPLLDALINAFPQITSLVYVINQKHNETIYDQDVLLHHGKDHIIEKLGGLSFKIDPKSFFQTNSAQAEKLYDATLNLAQISADDIVYDLYTGTGTIALFLAQTAKKVIGIEYIEKAIEDAYINAEMNQIENASFFAGDMKDILTESFIDENGQPDVIVTDPPRAGMHPDVIQTILQAQAKRIVYVSCNPATQARDLEALCVDYSITAVQPVDMFPHTHHVENIVRLDRKQDT